MRRVFPAALAILAALGAPGRASAQDGACPAQPANVFEYRDFAGPWERHGMTLDVGPLGCGTLTWWAVRDGTLRVAGDADFALAGPTEARSAGRIIAASDPASIPARDIVLTLNDDGTLTAKWGDTPLTFCRPWRHDPLRCGA